MELTWAAQSPDLGDRSIIYVGPEGHLTAAEFRAIERAHAMPLIENYAMVDFPRDRIIRVDEEGNVTQFPLDYPCYSFPMARR
jgi:hypothetical protein